MVQGEFTMILKRVLFYMIAIFCLILTPMEIMADDPPLDPVVEESQPIDTEDEKYTLEEFDGLSDDEKRDIYFNSPQLLPQDFNPADYWDVIHEEQPS